MSNIVLADEINRATPRTQSALLEAMQERQVTLGGTTMPLPSPPSGKPIKYGGCMAYDAGTALIYASKGNKTGDFYTFEPEAGTWAAC
jgi:hypothetical protein